MSPVGVTLYKHQMDAVDRMKNGCILNGAVGSGKSRTALAYYYRNHGGDLCSIKYVKMKKPKDLYIITTARKRDTKEWEKELIPFFLSPDPSLNLYENKVVIDSWNNIQKYAGVENSFFIFDEDRVTGSGVWVKTFLHIVKKNEWIILSATPGDVWADYIPVFIANGFYKNKTAFSREHIVYSQYAKYPKIDRYLNTGRLIRLRNSILIDMDFMKPTTPHHMDVTVSYDMKTYREMCRQRWNIWENRPIQNAAEFCYALRKIVNTAPSRELKILEIIEKHPKVIIFYNFDYELEILKRIGENVKGLGYLYAEWNGHKHQEIPHGDKWLYFVQYTAGCEGWNCITTDTIIFYSQNYSYKVLTQASGRIDRLNTPYHDLWYYHLKSKSGIDLAISRAIKNKKNFNEGKFYSR